MKLPFMDTLGSVGLVGERKAAALLCLGFYATLFFMIGLSARTELPEWVPVFSAMTLMYAMAFFSVAAEWFWGRWFATGLGYWGMTMTVMAWVTTRSLPPAMIIFGAMHGHRFALPRRREDGRDLRRQAGVARALEARRAGRHPRTQVGDPRGFVAAGADHVRAGAARRADGCFGMTAFALALIGFGGVLAARTYGVMALGASAAAVAALAIFGGAPSSVFAFFSQSVFFAGVDPRVMTRCSVRWRRCCCSPRRCHSLGRWRRSSCAVAERAPHRRRPQIDDAGAVIQDRQRTTHHRRPALRVANEHLRHRRQRGDGLR